MKTLDFRFRILFPKFTRLDPFFINRLVDFIANTLMLPQLQYIYTCQVRLGTGHCSPHECPKINWKCLSRRTVWLIPPQIWQPAGKKDFQGATLQIVVLVENKNKASWWPWINYLFSSGTVSRGVILGRELPEKQAKRQNPCMENFMKERKNLQVSRRYW